VLCVLDPVPVRITTLPDGHVETLDADYWPRDVDREGTRPVPFSGRILVDRSDFSDDPPADWRRLAPGRAVRLRHGPLIRCDEVVRNDAGEVVELRCSHAWTDSAREAREEGLRGEDPGDWQVGGAIHWVDAERSIPCQVRLYDRLFTVADPDAEAAESGKPFTAYLNPESLVMLEEARVEPSVGHAEPGARYQFERLGYFVRDEEASDELVFNRTVTLRDTWTKKAAEDGAPERGTPAARGTDRRGPELSPEEQRRRREAAAPERSPELEARRRLLADELGVDEEDAEILTRDEERAGFFEAALTAGADPQRVANWMVNELPREAGDRPLSALPFDAAAFGALVALRDDGTLSSSAAREVLAEMVESGASPEDVVERRGLRQVRDESALAPVVDRVLEAHPDKVTDYRDGRTGLMGFFMGQVMRETGGKAEPELARQLLEERLSSGS
ncbi:MAG TPA: hypothetical protein VK966_09785, partial [Longimicrobiales bacterium]|nr:hypothetical protein [Longimicrobiales bacterium]